jgi:hypothetical protein
VLRSLLPPAILFGAALVGASPALGQPQLTPGSAPGITEDRAVDPAPNAPGPYVGHDPQTFYNTEQRIAAVEGRLGALPPRQRRAAVAQIRSIRAEEATQRQRHGGELRDWDREHLNRRLDQLVGRFPGLRG